MSTVLITGAAGLIGSRLAEWLLTNTDHKIISIDNLSGGYRDNVIYNKDRLIFSVLDAGSNNLDAWFERYKPDYVFHFAAYAAECVSPFIRKYNYTNNLVVTANIINLCIKYGVKRLVFTSSMAVYGNAEAPFTETMIPSPVDPYGIAKFACELDIKIAGEQHGLDWCIVRPHNVYGRNQNIWDSYRNVLGIWMWKYLNNQQLAIYGDGTQVRSFSCIDDSLPALWQAAVNPKASKEIINLGGIHETSILEAAYTLIDVMGGGEIIYLPPRHEVKYAWSTWEKSVNILGFEHKTNLYTGLVDMWNWAKLQPARDRLIWNNYEIENGLYDYWKSSALKNMTVSAI